MSTTSSRPTFLDPDTLPKIAGFSQVVVAPAHAAVVHVSGQVALDRDGRLVGGADFVAQATQAFENVRGALIAAGTSFEHVLRINMFVRDMSHLAALREVRDRFVDRKNPPASTLLAVSGFFRDDLLFEMDATAIIPG